MAPRAPNKGMFVSKIAPGKRWRWLADAVPDALLILDAEGSVQYANPCAHTLFGCAAGSLDGCRLDELIPSERRAQA